MIEIKSDRAAETVAIGYVHTDNVGTAFTESLLRMIAYDKARHMRLLNGDAMIEKSGVLSVWGRGGDLAYARSLAVLARAKAAGLEPARKLTLDQLDLALAIDALAGGILLGPEQLELRLPVAEDVGGDSGELFDLADLVVELLGGVRRHIKRARRC